MRRFIAVCWLVGALGVAHAADKTPIYDSPEGGFAFYPPQGWETAKEAEEPFPTLSGPKDDLRAPYVVIQRIKDARELFEFADASIKEKLKDPRFQLGRRDSFQTADKAFGVKYVFTYTAVVPQSVPAQTVVYKQAYYLVTGPPGIIYVFLATVPDAGWEKYEPILDDMMRSYHLRPVVAPAQPAASAPAAKKTTVK